MSSNQDPFSMLPDADAGDLDQNDEDIGALGSILSWEDPADYANPLDQNGGNDLMRNSTPIEPNSIHSGAFSLSFPMGNSGLRQDIGLGPDPLAPNPFSLPSNNQQFLANYLAAAPGLQQNSTANAPSANNNPADSTIVSVPDVNNSGSGQQQQLPLILPALPHNPNVATTNWQQPNSNYVSSGIEDCVTDTDTTTHTTFSSQRTNRKKDVNTNNGSSSQQYNRRMSNSSGNGNVSHNKSNNALSHLNHCNNHNQLQQQMSVQNTMIGLQNQMVRPPSFPPQSNHVNGTVNVSAIHQMSKVQAKASLPSIQIPSSMKRSASTMAGTSNPPVSRSSSTNNIHSNNSLAVSNNGVSAMVSAEEKQKANRDRNREHARNTRLRKKAYLEKLKVTVDELCRERDTLIQERAASANHVMETLAARTEVLLGFLALRQHPTKHLDASLWNALISEHNFQCTLPVTPYRSFPASEVSMQSCQRSLHGIEAMISDSASLHMLFDSLLRIDAERLNGNTGNNNSRSRHRVSFRYSLFAENVAHPVGGGGGGTGMDGNYQGSSVSTGNSTSKLVSGVICNNNQVMARWQLSTMNLMEYGASSEVTKSGMLFCKFNSSHQITHLEMLFDVMAFMLQLKNVATDIEASYKAKNKVNESPSPTNGIFYPSAAIIPNTLHTANITTFFGPACITTSERPWTIVDVNPAWEKMTGYSASQVANKQSNRILHVPNELSDESLRALMLSVLYKRAGQARVVNINAKRELFEHVFRVFPLSSDSRVSHYLGVTVFYRLLTTQK